MPMYERKTKAELIKALRALERQLRLTPPKPFAADELHDQVFQAEVQNRALREAQQQLEESRNRYADLYDFAPVGYLTFSEEGVIREINLAAAAMLGGPREKRLGKPLSVYLRGDDRGKFFRHLRLCRETERPAVIELQLHTHDVPPLPVQIHTLAISDIYHGALDFRASIIDISQRKHAEDELRLAATVFEHCGEAIVVCDGHTNILSVNRAFCDITGYLAEEVVGKNAKQIDIGLSDTDHSAVPWQVIAESGYWQGDAWGHRKDGSLYAQGLTITAVKNERGEINQYISIFSDITERKAVAAQIQHLAHHDALTDLPNRALLHDRLGHALSTAQRNNTGVAVLFMDIDLFKSINDSLGHMVGDQLLRLIAARLTQCLRMGDTVSRRGGDEFIVVLGDVRSIDELTRAVEKILHSVCLPYTIDGMELNITASIGVSLYPQDGRDIETLIKHADIAMYYAKESGRNNYQFFIPDLNVNASQRLLLESSLHRALERDEFVLHYQPQVQAGTGKILGCEALIRWQHPDHGLILPDRFIPVAEKCGLINAIGEWVLRTACKQNRSWQKNGLSAIPVAVNLSAMQLRNKDFLRTVASVLRDGELDPRYLAVELTESTLLENVEATAFCLQRLKAMGLQIVLDDFGTGYSSLGYLKRFPVDKLKIDKSFMHDVPSGSDDTTLIRTIISMGQNLNIAVIAEGVETRAQFDFLVEEHCEEMQGDFCGQPMPAAEFASVLRASTRFN